MTTHHKAIHVLNEKQKDAVVHYYLNGGKTVSQQWIANHYGVHRKTIYNVLKERGVLLSKQERLNMVGIVQVVKELDLTADKIRAIANAPALTPAAIVSQLMQLDAPTLTRLFYDVIGAHHMQEALASQVIADAV